MLRKVGGLFLVSLLFFFVLFYPFTTALCVRDKDSGLLYCQKIDRELQGQDLRFEITFRHSVNRGVIREIYTILPLDLMFFLDTAYFENYGAGMLDSVPPDVVMTEEGRFLRLDYPELPQTCIAYSAAGIADHQLLFGDSAIRLFEINPYRTCFITIEKLSIFDQLRKR